MSRFLSVLAAIYILVLVPTTASAQEAPMPGRGEILELRRNDPRYEDGYRSFIYGNWVSGMDGLNDLLDRVNADLEGDSLVTMEQLEVANPCSVIYHREGRRFGHNGSCDTNAMAERLTYAAYCDGDSSCARWPMARHVYRIPSAPRLTPGERVEEMVERLDETTVTETVPAPAELGGWLTELSDNMGEEQPPTYGQVRDVIAAVGRTLTRAETASAGTDTPEVDEHADVADAEPDMTFTEDDVPGDESIERPTSAEEETASSTSTGATTSILTNPTLLWSIIVILSIMMILLLFKDNIRAWYRPIAEDKQEKPAPDLAPPALNVEQERGLKMYHFLKCYWRDFCKKIGENRELNQENLDLFFMAAEASNALVESLKLKIVELERKITDIGNAKTAVPLAPIVLEPKIEYRVDTKRVSELERELSDANAAKLLAETRARNAEEAKTLAEETFDAFKAQAKKLVNLFYQDGIANLDLAFSHATRSDVSQPGLIGTLKRIDQAYEQFKAMETGVLNDLLMHLDSELALVVSSPSIPLYHDRVSNAQYELPKVLPKKAPELDSWTGALDESVPDLEDGRMSLVGKVDGADGYAELAQQLEPASIPPKDGDMSIPPMESLSGEPTHPGIRPPESGPGIRPPEPGQVDDVPFRASKHAPRPVGRAKRKKERERRTTDSFERKAIEAEASRPPRDDEKTAVIDQTSLDRKREETRTPVPTLRLGSIPPPGALVHPPPPVVEPITGNGEDPDPTEAFVRESLPKAEPGSLSLFDDLPATADETGVTRKVVGKDS